MPVDNNCFFLEIRVSESIFRAKTIWKCSSEMNNQLEFHIYHDYNKVRLLHILCGQKILRCGQKMLRVDKNTLCGQKYSKYTMWTENREMSPVE